jgi:tetratricopeptide (TPR) repeat protein
MRRPPSEVFVVLAMLAVAALAQEPAAPDTALLEKYRGVMPVLATAREHLDAGDYERAEKQLADLTRFMPDLSEAHLLLAKARYAQERYAAALSAIEKAKATFEGTAADMVKVRAARVAELREEQTARAAAIAAAEAKLHQGNAKGTQAEIDSARQTVAVIDREIADLAVVPSLSIPAEYYFFHGNVLVRLRRHAEAVREYETALAILPAYSAAANNLASVFYDAGRYEDARRVIETHEANGAQVVPALKKAVDEALAAGRKPQE